MLLSQCLAISLSESKASDSSNSVESVCLSPEAFFGHNKCDERRVSVGSKQSTNSSDRSGYDIVGETTPTAPKTSGSREESSAQSSSIGQRLFERLVERNCYANSDQRQLSEGLQQQVVGENDPLSAGRQLKHSQESNREVYYALKRTHLAGFFVPNWLLLSGSLDDLQAIRDFWSMGLLLAPDGMRIDALGKFEWPITIECLGERGKTDWVA